jgi:hypothetical protein
MAKKDNDKIPICESYRGVGIHVFQTPNRISKVKRAIDDVYSLGALEQLYAYACEVEKPPEARLFAAARCESIWEAAVSNRETRPDLDLLKLRACTSSLKSLKWISQWEYGSLLMHDQEKRERVLTEAEVGR